MVDCKSLTAVGIGLMVMAALVGRAHAGSEQAASHDSFSSAMEIGSDDTSPERSKDGGVDELGKKDGGVFELGKKDGGAFELGKKDGGATELAKKDAGAFELGKKDGGAFELGKKDGGATELVVVE